MERMPGLMFIIDTRREHIAVKEAKKLGVKTIALIDTDSDPDLIDLPIPGNDDAMRAIELIVKELADAVIDGKQGRADKADSPQDQPRRRSTRSRSTRTTTSAGTTRRPTATPRPGRTSPPCTASTCSTRA